MNIGKYIAFALIATASINAAAEMKQVASSQKKAPAWIGTAEEGYIIVSAEEPTLAKAQEAAEQMIAERMVSAIARHVDTSSRSQISETNVNGKIESSDEFSRMTQMMSAKLPFLSGISLSKADGSYWIQKRDKKSGVESWEFHVRYPFFRTEQQRLIAEFEDYDAAQVAAMERLSAGIDTVDSLDGITAATGEADALVAYFFDETRRKRAESLSKRYAALPKEVTMSVKETGKGTARIEFELHGHPFKVYTKPTVTSSCARITSVTPVDGQFDIEFDTADCLEDEPNMIEVAVRVSSNRLKSSADITVGSDEAADSNLNLSAKGRMVVAAEDIDTETRRVEGIAFRFQISNPTGATFGISSAELILPDLKMPVIIEDCDAVFSVKGVIEITLESGGANMILEKRKEALQLAKLNLTIVNPVTESMETIKLTYPYTANW